MYRLGIGGRSSAGNILKGMFFPTCSQKRVDWVIFPFIAFCAYFFGESIYLQHLDQGFFYQRSFLPPLHFACTGTFESFSPSPSVEEFLSSPRATFTNCDEVAALPKLVWDGFQNSIIFLFGLAGILWRTLGISWANLAPIAGLLTAALAVSAYSLSRVFCRSPLIALTITFVFMTHASVVGQIIYLRDFSKAPFMVAALALIATAVLKPRRLRDIFLLAAAAGATISLGLGFRADLLVMLPIAIAAPVFVLRPVAWKDFCRRALALWLGLGLGFLLVRAGTIAITPPVAIGNNYLSHVFMLGFAEPFAAGTQSMADASYRILLLYRDEYLIGIVNLFQGRTIIPSNLWTSPSYDKESLELFVATFLTVPNDVLKRVFYSAQTLHHWVPLIWGPALISTIFVLWAARRNMFLFLAFNFALLTAVASLLLDFRHVFFFGIFGLGLGSLLIDCGLSAWSTRLAGLSMATLRSAAASLAVVLVGLSVLVGVMSLGTLYVQKKRIADIQTIYDGLEWHSIAFTQSDQRLVPTGDLLLPGRGEVDDHRNAMLFSRLTLRSKDGATSCGSDDLALTQVYKDIELDFPLRFWPLPHGAVRELYFPMMYSTNLQFTHLQFRGDLSGCDFEWQIAKSFPPKTVPMELAIVDGQIQQSYRGSWRTLATRFIWD